MTGNFGLTAFPAVADFFADPAVGRPVSIVPVSAFPVLPEVFSGPVRD